VARVGRVECVFRGNLHGSRAEDGAPRSRKIAYFVSSTFRNTQIERDLDQFGLELEVKEMCWGISESLLSSHQTTSICMEELRKCLRTSISLSFVGVLSNRYGFRPVC